MNPQLLHPRQQRFASCAYAMKKLVTRWEKRREKFLAEVELVEVPWRRLQALVEPEYPTGGRVGRPPAGVSLMLRLTILHQSFGLADEALGDAIYDSQTMHIFLGIDPSREAVPGVTPLLKFRRRLEEHKLNKALFEGINAHLAEQGLLLREGTMVDTSIIAAPPSTKNEAPARGPEMHCQTENGNEWHCGRNTHVGAAADAGPLHSLHTTAANESDVAHIDKVLLHGQDAAAFRHVGYTGLETRAEIIEAQAEDKIRSDIEWNLAKRRNTINKMAVGRMKTLTKALQRVKGQLRARAEHPFPVVKNLFMHTKVCYKRMAHRDAPLQSLFGLADLVIA